MSYNTFFLQNIQDTNQNEQTLDLSSTQNCNNTVYIATLPTTQAHFPLNDELQMVFPLPKYSVAHNNLSTETQISYVSQSQNLIQVDTLNQIYNDTFLQQNLDSNPNLDNDYDVQEQQQFYRTQDLIDNYQQAIQDLTFNITIQPTNNQEQIPINVNQISTDIQQDDDNRIVISNNNNNSSQQQLNLNQAASQEDENSNNSFHDNSLVDEYDTIQGRISNMKSQSSERSSTQNIIKKKISKDKKKNKDLKKQETKNVAKTCFNPIFQYLHSKYENKYPDLFKNYNQKQVINLKQMIEFSKCIQNTLLQQESLDLLALIFRQISNSKRIKDKRLVIKYIDMIGNCIIDPNNFKTFKPSQEENVLERKSQ